MISTRRCVEVLKELERQLPMARSIGRMALRTARPAKPKQDAAPARQGTEAPDPASGAVDGYHSLTAREVIALVRDCDDPTLDWIRSTEQAGKARVTVLRAIEQRGRPT